MSDSDNETYAPFILMSGNSHSLLLFDVAMSAKAHVFAELGDDGWMGNGYDWASIAQVAIAEQLPEYAEEISFDPEAGMFTAIGSQEAIEQLGAVMCDVFHDEEQLRDLLSRAELD